MIATANANEQAKPEPDVPASHVDNLIGKV